jgi:hypothetical protein
VVPGSSCFCKYEYTFFTYVNFMPAAPMFGTYYEDEFNVRDLEISKKILPFMQKIYYNLLFSVSTNDVFR